MKKTEQEAIPGSKAWQEAVDKAIVHWSAKGFYKDVLVWAMQHWCENDGLGKELLPEFGSWVEGSALVRTHLISECVKSEAIQAKVKGRQRSLGALSVSEVLDALTRKVCTELAQRVGVQSRTQLFLGQMYQLEFIAQRDAQVKEVKLRQRAQVQKLRQKVDDGNKRESAQARRVLKAAGYRL